jgi:hypothetical protein
MLDSMDISAIDQVNHHDSLFGDAIDFDDKKLGGGGYQMKNKLIGFGQSKSTLNNPQVR